MMTDCNKTQELTRILDVNKDNNFQITENFLNGRDKKMKASLMLGVNPNTAREDNDFYATDPKAMELALPYLKQCGLSHKVWECACGEGHLSEVLKDNGYDVYSSDLIDRGYGEVKDFLKCDTIWEGDILTNPPFKYAEQFVRQGMKLINQGNKVCLFLKIQFLESSKRYQLFKDCPLKYLLVYSDRQKCCRNAEFDKYSATTQCYAWYIFEKGYKSKPTIDWIK